VRSFKAQELEEYDSESDQGDGAKSTTAKSHHPIIRGSENLEAIRAA